MSHEAQLRRLAALEGDIAVAVKHYAAVRSKASGSQPGLKKRTCHPT